MAREAPYVHLVNDCSTRWLVEGIVALPIVSSGVHYDILHRCRGVVAFQAGRRPTVILGDNYGAPVRVQHNLVGIKPHPACGIETPVCAITVQLTWFRVRHKYMP